MLFCLDVTLTHLHQMVLMLWLIDVGSCHIWDATQLDKRRVT